MVYFKRHIDEKLREWKEDPLYDAISSSLEPFGEFVYYDSKAGDAERHVDTIPLYAHIIVRTSRPPVLLPQKSGTLVQRSLVIFSLAMLNFSVKAVFSRRYRTVVNLE